MKKLLLIEDDAIMGESLVQRFELEGFDVLWCRRLAEASARLGPGWGAVISDVRLSDGLATEWFATLAPAERAIPWFFLTGYGSVSDAVAATRFGAREYLTKPFDVEKLVSVVTQAVCASNASEGEDAVLGVSRPMRQLESMVRKVAKQKASVLLTGESGVGKEVAAQLLHQCDLRQPKGEFVAVNCAAVPEAMMEAEFFGYEKGAFTGSMRAHKGFLERAQGGTLFLDEVAELPPSMQAKLLRALQERCFYRLGAEKMTHSDFRLVAATNRDLYTYMAEGHFREDLFYRIAVVRVAIPPLRERPEDIRWLAERFLRQLAAEQQRPLDVTDDFLCSLMVRRWRGNIRELRAFLEQEVALSENGLLNAPSEFTMASSRLDDSSVPEGIGTLQSALEVTERLHIQRALSHTQGNIAKTADTLDISRKTLWEKMKRLGIDKKSAAP